MSRVKYLISRRTGTGIRHAPVPWVRGRKGFLLYLTQGHSVLHVGCADNLAYQERFLDGSHLHKALESQADAVGIDIDASAVAWLQAQGLNVHAMDIHEDAVEDVLPTDLDTILAPEIIEHLDDPGRLLRRLAQLAAPHRARLLVSVPNAFSATARHHSHGSFEQVNPDHRAWYSRATLDLLLLENGWQAHRWWGSVSGSRLPRWAPMLQDREWSEFQETLREEYPAIWMHPKPWRTGNPRVPVLAKRLHHWLKHERVRYPKAMEYDGLIVEAKLRTLVDVDEQRALESWEAWYEEQEGP